MPYKSKEAEREYYEKNKERISARVRERREKNKERVAAYDKAYNQRLPDPVILRRLKESGFPAQYITPELIEVRRLSILIKRDLKEQVQA